MGKSGYTRVLGVIFISETVCSSVYKTQMSTVEILCSLFEAMEPIFQYLPLLLWVKCG